MNLLNYPDDPARVGSPDYQDYDEDDIDQVRDQLDALNRDHIATGMELGQTRLLLRDARHVLRRVECVLRGEGTRRESDALLALADECKAALEAQS